MKLVDGIGFLVRVLSTRVTALFEELTSQTEVTPGQFGSLLTLHQQGTLTLTELASAVKLDRSSLGEMVGRLSAKGLVRRSSNGRDRRSTKVSITADGEAALLKLVRGAAALQDTLLAPIPLEHRQTFLLCLKLVTEPSTEADTDAADSPHRARATSR